MLEEVQHEPDVTVLGAELWLVEDVHQWIIGTRRFEHETRDALLHTSYLVRLVVVNDHPVPFAVLDPVDVLSRADDPATGRNVASGKKLEERRRARPIGAHDADNVGALDRAVRGHR